MEFSCSSRSYQPGVGQAVKANSIAVIFLPQRGAGRGQRIRSCMRPTWTESASSRTGEIGCGRAVRGGVERGCVSSRWGRTSSPCLCKTGGHDEGWMRTAGPVSSMSSVYLTRKSGQSWIRLIAGLPLLSLASGVLLFPSPGNYPEPEQSPPDSLPSKTPEPPEASKCSNQRKPRQNKIHPRVTDVFCEIRTSPPQKSTRIGAIASNISAIADPR